MDQMLMCFLAGSRSVVLTKLFRLLCNVFGHLDFRTGSFRLQTSDLPGWDGFMKKLLWQLLIFFFLGGKDRVSDGEAIG